MFHNNYKLYSFFHVRYTLHIFEKYLIVVNATAGCSRANSCPHLNETRPITLSKCVVPNERKCKISIIPIESQQHSVKHLSQY